MTVITTETSASSMNEQQLAVLIQYTVEAYKTFEKLAESLPNEMTAKVFKQFAADERENRDLIEMKIAATGQARPRVTLGGDLAFQEILEGEVSNREACEYLIARERTLEARLAGHLKAADPKDRNFLIYLTAVKRAHVVELQRELELLRLDSNWWKREDPQHRIVYGH
jgi:rubrerythrin